MLGSKIDKTNPNFSSNSTGSAKNIMQAAGEAATIATTIASLIA